MLAKRLFICVILVVYGGLSVLQSGVAEALTDEQRSIYARKINFYDVDTCGVDTNTDDVSGRGPVYMMGDSITVGVKNDLENELKDAGVEVTKINSSGGRSFEYQGSGPDSGDGIEAIKQDKEQIKKSNTVIIALGTNAEGGESKGNTTLFKKYSKQALDLIRSDEYNPDAKIYWVKLFATNPGVNTKAYNEVIDDMPNVTPIETLNENIDLQPDGTHPAGAGYKKLAKVIASSLASGSVRSVAVGNIPIGGKTVGASEFTDTQGYRDNSIVKTYSYAELSPPGLTSDEVTQKTATNLGRLKYKQKLAITYKGKTVVAEKLDIGLGGDDVKGKSRDIDILYDKTAKALGIKSATTWTDVVKVQGVPDDTPLGPVSGGIGGSGTAAASPENTELSLRDKIAQMLFVGMSDKNEAKEIVKKHKIGGIMLVKDGKSLFSKSALDEVQGESDTPLLVASDEEGGGVQRLKSQTGAYPSAKELGSKSNKDVERLARAYGKKLSDIGVNVNYAPVVDIDDGSNSVISGNKRAFSSDPEVIADKAGAFAKGMRESNVVPVFKHFPGHGRANGDSHLEAVTTPHINSLKATDLKPYETLLDENPSGVMVGHLKVPGLTDGKPATLSSKAIDLLRNDYNFDGVIFSDEIANMKAIADKYSPAEAVSLSVKAGIDMPLFNKSSRYSSLDQQVEKTIDKIQADVSTDRIEASYKRITSLKKSLGLLDSAKKQETTCTCEASGDNSTGGGENNKIAFDFLVSKVGMSAEQAAGAVGSMIAESGGYDGGDISPTVIYGGAHSNTPPPGDTAWGIAQFVGGRKAALINYARDNNKKVYEVNTQLNYIKYELEHDEKPAFVKLKATNTPEEAATSWTVDFERPSPKERADSLPGRIKNANKIFRKYSSSAPSVNEGESNTSSDCPDSAGGDGSGESKGNFIWPTPSGTLFGCWNEDRRNHRHAGIDIGVAVGTTTKASDGGTVEVADGTSGGGYGNVIVIKHPGGKWTLYGHMSKILVRVGQKVDQGSVIGKSGGAPGAPGSGSSQGPHVHFNIQAVGGPQGDGSNTLNPLNYLPADSKYNLNGCKKS